MGDLLSYFYAVINHWVALMSGGIITVLLALWERRQKQNIPGKWYAVIIALFVLLAMFQAWRDEHIKVREAENNIAELKDQNTPKFEGEIEEISVGYSPEIGSTQVFIRLSVTNTGAPSIIKGWPLHLKSESFETTAPPTFIPEGYQLTGADGDVTAVFNRQIAIDEKADKVIERGGIISGWLRYVLKDVPQEQVSRPGTNYTVTFKDVLKHEYEASYKMTGNRLERPRYFPGSGAPFKRTLEPLPSPQPTSPYSGVRN